MRVVLAFSPQPGQVLLEDLTVSLNATVEQALKSSSLALRLGWEIGHLSVGVWGRRCALSTVLAEDDRLEVYRPLRCDPKEARRQRYRQRPGRALRPKSLKDVPPAAPEI